MIALGTDVLYASGWAGPGTARTRHGNGPNVGPALHTPHSVLNRKDPPMPDNSLFTIRPYKHAGLWVFDDPSVGLEREPFVSGADSIIDRFAEQIPDAASGFNVIFSAVAFPGSRRRVRMASRRGRRQLVSLGRAGDGRLAVPGAAEVLRRGAEKAVREVRVGTRQRRAATSSSSRAEHPRVRP